MVKQEKKIACLIYFFGKRYERIGKCAVDSFKKYHPDVDLIHVNKENAEQYRSTEKLKLVGHGIYKYMLAAEIMMRFKYDKIIVLGADTITCSRLTEFIDNDEDDILATLDYPYRLYSRHRNMFLSPDSETHLNADVVCFNNPSAIVDIVRIAKSFPEYVEQAGLNYVVWSEDYNYSCSIVDGPYKTSEVVYNARAKGNIVAKPNTKPWGEHTNKFYVKDQKLYTGDNKQIKVWHYCDGLGVQTDAVFMGTMNHYINDWFNKETKEFFEECCDCGDFFKREFAF